MKLRFRLRTKVLLFAVLNAVLLAVLLIGFARTQLAGDFGVLLFGESRDRIAAVVAQFGNDWSGTAANEREALIERYKTEYGVDFHIFSLSGSQLAGPPVSLPEAVQEEMESMRSRSPLAQMMESGVARGRGFASRGSRGQSPARGGTRTSGDNHPFYAYGDSRYWTIVRLPLRSANGPTQPGVLVMAASSLFDAPLFFNLTPWFTLLGLAVGVTLLCWLPFVRGTTRAVTELSSATSKVALGAFRTKVNVARSDELGELGESFNRMSVQLESLVHGQKQFLRDAAHELRSPLARMQAALGNILESESNPETELFIEDLRQEVDLMSSLTGELLALAREEGKLGGFKLSEVNVYNVAARAAETEDPTGNAGVQVLVAPDIAAKAHEESLFRGLSNFVRNAVRYAGGSGAITITAERRNGGILLLVSDRGPGIPQEFLERVFAPFFRLDASRDRNTGGSGLGMAIARASIESCGGTVYCRNTRPGLEVVIMLQAA